MQPGAVALGPVAGAASGTRSLAGLRAQAGALLDSLERLLTSPFPVAAPLPAAALLLLITRILSVDDSATGDTHFFVACKPRTLHSRALKACYRWMTKPQVRLAFPPRGNRDFAVSKAPKTLLEL